jgi:hypothetical protein
MTNKEFHKKMTVSDLETYFCEENYKFLIVQVFDKECYRFDLENTEEHVTTRQIILDKNNFIYTGWKVARKLANWIRNTNEWTEFLNKKKSAENHDDDVLMNVLMMTKGMLKRVTAMMMMSLSMATETVKMMKITATMIATTIMTVIVKRKKRKTMMDL